MICWISFPLYLCSLPTAGSFIFCQRLFLLQFALEPLHKLKYQMLLFTLEITYSVSGFSVICIWSRLLENWSGTGLQLQVGYISHSSFHVSSFALWLRYSHDESRRVAVAAKESHVPGRQCDSLSSLALGRIIRHLVSRVYCMPLCPSIYSWVECFSMH